MKSLNVPNLVITAFLLTTAFSAYSDEITRDDVVGQWKSVVKNPAHKNTLANRYMRHTFFEDGVLIVESKEDANDEKSWEFDGGVFTVNSSHDNSEFIEQYRISNINELEKISFKSIVNGEPLADYNPKEKYIRQGSEAEASMNTLDIFESSKSAMNFIDPSTLKVDEDYILSKTTPIMPSYEVSDITLIVYAQSDDVISIKNRETINNTVWYQVVYNDTTGWINSIALFGQDLR